MALPSHYQKLVATTISSNLREACQVHTVELTPPAPDEILVKTYYTGVNAADYLIAQNRYLSPTPPPHDMGSESVGEVVAVGEKVTQFAVGSFVLAIGYGFREYFTVRASHALPIPSAKPETISLGVSGLTAGLGLNVVGEMQSGETVLVTAAAGGTGSFAVQLAKLAGNHVIGTCGSADKVAYLQSLGCDRVVNYRQESLFDVLKNEYPRGIDIAFESVGGEMFDTAVNMLAVRGRLVTIGSISEYEGGPQKVNKIRISYKLVQKSASVRGFWLAHYLKQGRTELPRLLELVDSGKLQLSVDPTSFRGVEQCLDAIEYLYSGRNVGKVIVDFRS